MSTQTKRASPAGEAGMVHSTRIAPSWVWLGVGAVALAFTTWRYNVPIAAWVAPVLLMRFFRQQARWPTTLIALPLLAASSAIGKHAAWGLGLDMEIATDVLAVAPLLAALYVDRSTSRRLGGLPGTLVFPSVYVSLDFALSFLPLGTVFSVAPTQFHVTPLVQAASVTGVWGVSFLVMWLAPVVNLLWCEGLGSRSALAVASGYGAVVLLVLFAGGLRLAAARPQGPTVRVAGVTVAHPRNYWDEVVDRGTPTDEARALAPELGALENGLFAESERAVAAGAKLVFWSEGGVVMLPEHREEFVRRASAFAREHGVYFVPTYLVFEYGQPTGENALLMIQPDGTVAYRYEKTMSWYATDSDGVLRAVDTPYGRVGTAICFDMDFPGFVRQAAQQNVDVMLVPAYDTLGTRPYHTEVGLLRAVDYGFSVVRQTNEGTSMAVDSQGRVLAYQDFFATDSPVMLADVPTKGTRTLYGLLGDWFAYLAVVVAVATVAAAVFATRGTGRGGDQPAGVS